MKVSFEFNDGENASQMVAAIVGLFGATVGAVQSLGSHAPDVGADADETPNAAPPAFDSNGLPWDARIHSDTKAITDKGVWRQRRSVSKELLASVTAELKARAGQPATTAAPVQAPAAAPIAPSTLPSLNAPAPIAPPPLAPAPAAPKAFDTLVNFLAANTQSPANTAGRLTEQWISDALKGYGAVDTAGNGSLQALAHAPDEQVKAIHNAIASALGVAGV